MSIILIQWKARGVSSICDVNVYRRIELTLSTRCGHTAFSEADIEVNARCLLLRGRGNKMTARPRAFDDEGVYALPVFMRFLDPLRAMA